MFGTLGSYALINLEIVPWMHNDFTSSESKMNSGGLQYKAFGALFYIVQLLTEPIFADDTLTSRILYYLFVPMGLHLEVCIYLSN